LNQQFYSVTELSSFCCRRRTAWSGSLKSVGRAVQKTQMSGWTRPTRRAISMLSDGRPLLTACRSSDVRSARDYWRLITIHLQRAVRSITRVSACSCSCSATRAAAVFSRLRYFHSNFSPECIIVHHFVDAGRAGDWKYGSR